MIKMVKIIKCYSAGKQLKIVYDTNKYIKKIAKGGMYFHTFINKENLAAGILRLGPCEVDTQEPHESDEIYYVVKGDGFLMIDKKDYPVSEGMSYYVGKKIPHKFHGNTAELVVVYFFSGPDT
jgi:mannose-6-phosphate isomerase-like protein (cupin superfamily)